MANTGGLSPRWKTSSDFLADLPASTRLRRIQLESAKSAGKSDKVSQLKIRCGLRWTLADSGGHWRTKSAGYFAKQAKHYIKISSMINIDKWTMMIIVDRRCYDEFKLLISELFDRIVDQY